MLIAPAVIVLAAACTPREPVNQVENRGHEMPWRQVITFTPCTVADTSRIFADGVVPDPGAAPIEYTVQPDKETGELVKSNPVTLQRGRWYRMQIALYNQQGALITQAYLTAEQAPLHQFFFNCTQLLNPTDRYPSPIESQVTYKYADALTLNGVRQPMGFDGVLQVLPTATQSEFNLRCRLVHVIPPAVKTDAQGNFYPFDAPGKHIIGVTDLDLQLPVRVQE